MSSLFWAVLDNDQKKQAAEILATFDKDSKDEMGLMSITIALSNLMFPGTSVLHTRLRYVYLIGWIFLEAMKSNNELSKDILHKKEKELRKVLQLNKGQNPSEDYFGILGSTKIIDRNGDGDELSQPPFSVYFNLLKEWNIIIDKSLSITELYRGCFCPKYLKILENDFDNSTFKLSEDECEYIVNKIPLSILHSIFKQNIALESKEHFVDFDATKIEDELQQKLFKDAQNFSLLMWGVMLYYDFYLDNNSAQLKNNFKVWSSRIKDVIIDWNPEETLEHVEQSVSSSQREFIIDWFEYIKKNINNISLENPAKITNIDLEEFLRKREKALKGDRSRLWKKLNDEVLEDARFGINPIEYRWSKIRRFKKDFNNATS